MESINKTPEYVTSKEKCQEIICGVCDGCGGELEPMETVDNSGAPTFWAGCIKCQKFHWGTNVDIFETGKNLVSDLGWTPYTTMRRPSGMPEDTDYNEYYIRSQISGACSKVRDVLAAHPKAKLYAAAPDLLEKLEQFITLSENNSITYKELEEARKLIFRIKNG